jgi:histidine triad (HIT) family protein
MERRDWYCEDVLSGKISIQKIWEDDRILAFYHPTPSTKHHAVVIPKAHVRSIMDPLAVDGELLASMVTGVQKAVVALGLGQEGFYVRTNAVAPGVTPHMHWHIHEFESSR